MLVTIGLVLLWSCEKDTEVITAVPGDLPTLGSSATVLELDPESADQPAVTFNWSAVDVQWSDNSVAFPIIGYVLQLSLEEDNFQRLLLSKDTEGTSVQFTHEELNTALIGRQKEAGTQVSVKARLRVTIAANRLEYTNIIDMTMTPYDDEVMLPSLWIAGSLNGWSHSDNYRVASINSDEQYEGYIFFDDTNTAFKFSTQAHWDDTNYGHGGTNQLDDDGDAGNLTLPAPGYYLLEANTSALTWSATEVIWGIIGDAAGGWGDHDDVSMTYDAEDRVWRATTTMSPGEWKFRANSGWDINFGVGEGEGLLAYGGDNFELEEGGTYLITLDLSNPGRYRYTLERP